MTFMEKASLRRRRIALCGIEPFGVRAAAVDLSLSLTRCYAICRRGLSVGCFRLSHREAFLYPTRGRTIQARGSAADTIIG